MIGMGARSALRRALPGLAAAAVPGGALGRETQLPPLAQAAGGRATVLDAPHDGAEPVAVRPRQAAPDTVRGRWRFPSLFWAVWLFYLYFPLRQAHARGGWPGALATIAIVLFGVIYTAWFVRIRAARRSARIVPMRQRWAVVAAMIGLTAVAGVGSGESSLTMLTYVAVVAGMTLPFPAGMILIAGLAAGTALLPRVIPGWQFDPGIPVQICLAGLAMWGVSQLILRNYELALARDRIGALAVEEERARLARDLHDILGHSLTVVTVKAELAGRLVHSDPDRAEKEILEVERLARDALADVRAAIGGYREVTLATELVAARAALDAAGIEADLPTAVDAVPGTRRQLFGWAVRDGVTNVVRHSGASRCSVRVDRDTVTVTDDGQGAGPPDAVEAGQRGDALRGHGLRGLAERATDAGAVLRAGAGPGGAGFRLQVAFARQAESLAP